MSLEKKPPHPATIVQRRKPHAAAIGAKGLPPHPATVLQQCKAAPEQPSPRPPHPATIAQRRASPGGPAPRPPHPATVVQRKTSAPPATARGALQRMEDTGSFPNMSASPIVACTGILVVRWSRALRTGGTMSFGTGVLIDDHRVLTCAHNVVEVEDGVLTGAVATEVTFYPGTTNVTLNHGRLTIPHDARGVAVAVCFYHRSYASSDSRSYDVAVLRLDGPVPHEVFPSLIGNGELARMGKFERKSIFDEGPQIPARIHGYTHASQSITITEVNASINLLVYNASTITGTSGSPVYSGTTLLGVHTSSSRQAFGVGLFDPILEFVYITFLVKGSGGFVQALSPGDFAEPEVPPGQSGPMREIGRGGALRDETAGIFEIVPVADGGDCLFEALIAGGIPEDLPQDVTGLRAEVARRIRPSNNAAADRIAQAHAYVDTIDLDAVARAVGRSITLYEAHYGEEHYHRRTDHGNPMHPRIRILLRTIRGEQEGHYDLLRRG